MWDYAGDGYVHRLIQNRADGKLVELPSASGTRRVASGSGGPSDADALAAEKFEAIGIEYSYLLTSQLDAQRIFYEEQQAELEGKLFDLRDQIRTMSEFEQYKLAMAREKEEYERVKAKDDDDLAEAAARARLKAEAKAERSADLARRLEKELEEERAVSAGLLEKMAVLKERAEEADIERNGLNDRLKDCEEQLRDVMFFLESREKIEQAGGAAAEAAGGTVVLPTPPPLNGSSKKKKKNKRG